MIPGKRTLARTWRSMGAMFPAVLMSTVLAFGLFFDQQASRAAPQAHAVAALNADLARANASNEASDVARWAVSSGDHGGLPFLLWDKPHSRLFVFDARGRLQSTLQVTADLYREHIAALQGQPVVAYVLPDSPHENGLDTLRATRREQYAQAGGSL